MVFLLCFMKTSFMFWYFLFAVFLLFNTFYRPSVSSDSWILRKRKGFGEFHVLKKLHPCQNAATVTNNRSTGKIISRRNMLKYDAMNIGTVFLCNSNTKILNVCFFICDTLHDLVPFVPFKKHKNHLWMSLTFSKVTGFNLQLY